MGRAGVGRGYWVSCMIEEWVIHRCYGEGFWFKINKIPVTLRASPACEGETNASETREQQKEQHR